MNTTLRSLAIMLAFTSTAARGESSILNPQKGDVICSGYEPETKSCATTVTVRGGTGDVFSAGGVTVITDFGPPVTMVQIGSTRIINDLHCMVPGTSEFAMEPDDLPGLLLMRIAMLGIIGQLEEKGYCARYVRCGSQYAAIAYVAEKRAPSFDQLFTYFAADDPETATLTTRPMHSTDLEQYQGNVAQECLPAT